MASLNSYVPSSDIEEDSHFQHDENPPLHFQHDENPPLFTYPFGTEVESAGYVCEKFLA